MKGTSRVSVPWEAHFLISDKPRKITRHQKAAVTRCTPENTYKSHMCGLTRKSACSYKCTQTYAPIYMQYVSTHTNLYTHENTPSGPHFAGVAGLHRGHTASPGGNPSSSCLTGKKLITMETVAINSDLSKQETEKQALLFGGTVAMGLLSPPCLHLPQTGSAHIRTPVSEPIDPDHQSPGLCRTSCPATQVDFTFECGHLPGLPCLPHLYPVLCPVRPQV